MDRTAARALAASTLIATTSYTVGAVNHVFQGALEVFDGRTPVAVITSRSMRMEVVAREVDTIHNGLSVSIYVRKPDGEAGAAAAETQLDTLVRQAIIAFEATGAFEHQETNAAPDGYPLRDIDGVLYRVERIPLIVLEEGTG